MHSTLVRAQNVFGFFTTVAFAVAALIAASDIFAPRTPSAVVSVDKVQVYARFSIMSAYSLPYYFSSTRHSKMPYYKIADFLRIQLTIPCSG
jgi:hypothetical protein